MELSAHGLRLWWGTADAPGLTLGGPGEPAGVTVGVAPPSPAHRVELRLRLDGGAPRTIYAPPLGTDAAGRRQTHRALLPPVAPGTLVEVAPLLTSLGRVLAPAGYPMQARWPAAPAGLPGAHAVKPAHVPAARPPLVDVATGRFPFQLEFLFGVTCRMRQESLGPGPDGLRLNFLIEEGVVEGPRLNGRFRAEGGDWMRLRPDGIGIPDIRVTFELDDGALILMESSGTFDLGAQGYAQALAGRYPSSGNFMSTPRFYASSRQYAWLERAATFGVGSVDMASLTVRDDVFRIVRPDPA